LHDQAGRALDIGCGVGGAMVDLRGRGWEVIGVEPDPALARVARTRFGLDVRGEFFDSTTFPDGEAFDLVYSCHVWEHLAAPRETCVAAHELLATKRGHLLIVVPTFRRARTLAWSCFTAPHTYMFTEVSLGNLLEASGFDVVVHRYAAGGDTELWLLARARPAPAVSGHEATRRESPGAVQRELVTVPLRAPLGLPGRLGAHVRTLMADPSEFKARFARWSSSRLGRVRSTLRRDG
jgi:SAM-dependent methyltransferase